MDGLIASRSIELIQFLVETNGTPAEVSQNGAEVDHASPSGELQEGEIDADQVNESMNTN